MSLSDCMRCGMKMPLPLLPLHTEECNTTESVASTCIVFVFYYMSNTMLSKFFQFKSVYIFFSKFSRVSKWCDCAWWWWWRKCYWSHWPAKPTSNRFRTIFPGIWSKIISWWMQKCIFALLWICGPLQTALRGYSEIRCDWYATFNNFCIILSKVANMQYSTVISIILKDIFS